MYMITLIFFLCFSAQDLDCNVGDNSHGNTFGNAVEERHSSDADVARNRLGKIAEINVDYVGQHVEAYHDQCRSRCKGRDGKEDRGEEQSEAEEDCSGNSGKTGTAAFGNAGSTLNESCCGRSTKNSTCAGSNSICHQRALDARKFSVFVEHVCLGRYTDQSSDGIKHIDKQECKHDHEELACFQNGEIQFSENRGKAWNGSPLEKSGNRL